MTMVRQRHLALETSISFFKLFSDDDDDDDDDDDMFDDELWFMEKIITIQPKKTFMTKLFGKFILATYFWNKG